MAANRKNIMIRYSIVVLFMTVVGICIVGKATQIMFGERQYWQDVADRFVNDSVPILPNRGNILSADGKLMASSLPEYRIYMDFKAGGYKKDTMLMNHLDEICRGLNRIFPDRTAAQFKQHLLQGRKKGSRNYLIYPRRISYIQYKEAKRLPVFNLNKYRGGFHEQMFNNRKKPFGSLAARTLGDLYADTAQGAKNGIELAFDTLLKGHNGMAHRQKVMNQYLSLVTVPPVDGCDVVTTLNVDMQDICEKALVDKLKEIDAEVGVAILMEVKTGEIKAIVNMTKAGDGKYYEMRNNAISDMLEPGSTFKTASLMVALEDGMITPHTEVNTGNGIMMIEGREMRDHNANRGGYGKIDATQILGYSSNVGVSYLINKHYRDNPQKFVDGLKRMSIDQPLHLQIAGEGVPNIRGPKDRKARGEYFSATSLPWMSIGYETQLPPINILTFYNAIANNGRMVRPKFVKEIMQNGSVIEEYPTEVINKQICSQKTLDQIRVMLRKVVTDGLAKQAGNAQFAVSGKTGTAQIWDRTGKTGGHLVSFCGYFPSDAPKYSCIVSIRNPHIGYPSGGAMAGSVFGKIAERVYAQDLYMHLAQAVDSSGVMLPVVKNGDRREAQWVLDALDVPARQSLLAAVSDDGEQAANLVPNVVGMGAKDAIYQLERCGLTVKLSGTGKVKSQSVAGGSRVIRGQRVTLTLH